MSIIINRNILVDALDKVSKVVTKTSTSPVLSSFYIKSDAKYIKIIGSNGDVSIAYTIEVDDLQVVVEDDICITAPLNLHSVVKKMGETIKLEAEGTILKVSSEKSKFNLNSIDGEEYPKISFSPTSEKPTITLSKLDLKYITRKTTYAASVSESRPILQGVHFHLNGRVEVNCTDSHRLARIIREGNSTDELQSVVPAKSLIMVDRIMDDDATIDIFFDDQSVIFKSESATVISRLLDGNYPDISRLIPNTDQYQTKIILSTQQLIQSLDLVSVASKQADHKIVKMAIQEDGLIHLFVRDEITKAEDTFKSNIFEGEPITLSFSTQYAIDALKTVDTDTVCMNFQGAMRPFTISPTNDASEIQLVLPVRTA